MDYLEHEDLLIKLRAKLNEEKIKLWEPPYVNNDENKSFKSLQDLACKFSEALNIDKDIVLAGLQELRDHSIDRVKANEEFKETGCATFRVRVSLAGQKPNELKISLQLTVTGDELIKNVSDSLDVDKSRIKLIHNGRVLKSHQSLEEQGVKNGAQIMALVMAEGLEQLKQEDKRYMEMKATLDDATLLTEVVDDDDDGDDEYMKLEDQSGKAVDLPAAEKRALMVGLALHERGRTAANARDYSLALVLFLEADRQFSACRSSLLSAADNWALLQLDVAWSYLRLRQLRAAPDAAARLVAARKALRDAYGEDCQRVIALKGNAANERVMFARLYLLQGIVAYHQNKREEAREMLEKAERELNSLKVDEQLVHNLMELGWSESQARWGLRAGGTCDRAHECLLDVRRRRQEERDKHRQEREQRLLGICMDGSPVSRSGLKDLEDMGFERNLAVTALKNSNNNVTDAVRLINDHPEMFESEPSDEASSDESTVAPDSRLISELVSMGYEARAARDALAKTHNRPAAAVELLLGGTSCDLGNPSTSEGVARKRPKKDDKKRKKERETALRRLKQAINADEEEYLGASLSEEEEFLRQYKALI